MINDTEEQPDEERLRPSLGAGDPEYRIFHPHGVGCVTLPLWMCSLTWKLPAHYTVGIFMEASSGWLDESLIPFPAPSSLWRMGGGTENSNLLIMA